MKKYFSLREISQQLGIPKSTVVKYKDFFSEFLTMAGDGKRKKFDENSLDVLRTIRELREEQKLDWMEIKETLAEKFGVPEEPETETAVATVPQAQKPEKLERLEHIVSLLGGQVLKLADAVQDTHEQVSRTGKHVVIVARYLAQTERKLDMVISELLSRDDGAKQNVKELTEDMKNEFSRLNASIAGLHRGIAQAQQQPAAADDNSEVLGEIKQKMDRIVTDSGMFQSKYQVLVRENEILKHKLKEMAKEQYENTADERRGGGGWKSWFKKT